MNKIDPKSATAASPSDAEKLLDALANRDESALQEVTRLYGRMLEILIESWRDDFRDEKLPFAVVVLPENTTMPDHESWEEVRRRQRITAVAVPAVIAVESGDLCEADNIHPPTKYGLALRLCEAMRAAGMIKS